MRDMKRQSRWVLRVSFGACLLLFMASAAGAEDVTSQVPFVGCKSDGQMGPLAAPKGKDLPVSLPPATAQHLAYYKAKYGIGVLGPRGWNCFGAYGSSGSSLFVSPEQLDSKKFFGSSWNGFSASAIQLSVSIGDTSGRFEVAEVVARVFPAHKSFVDDVIKQGIQPPSDFPFGPYPKDKLTYKSHEIVEYETPAQSEGLGTKSRLRKNADPIRGVEILSGEALDLLSLAVQLPKDLSDLAPIIVEQVEKDAKDVEHAE